MTPFDPMALLVMLLTFYPIVSPSALAQARRERPDYFAGGVIIGTHGDALRLPDGAVWDLIFDVDGPARRWQAIIPSGAPGGAAGDAVFPLEPGPLSPVDLDAIPRPAPPDTFGPLTAQALGNVGASDALIGGAQARIADAASSRALESVFADTIGPADGAVSEELGALYASVPDDVLARSHEHGGAIEANIGEYSEPAPPPISTDAGTADGVELPSGLPDKDDSEPGEPAMP